MVRNLTILIGLGAAFVGSAANAVITYDCRSNDLTYATGLETVRQLDDGHFATGGAHNVAAFQFGYVYEPATSQAAFANIKIYQRIHEATVPGVHVADVTSPADVVYDSGRISLGTIVGSAAGAQAFTKTVSPITPFTLNGPDFYVEENFYRAASGSTRSSRLTPLLNLDDPTIGSNNVDGYADFGGDGGLDDDTDYDFSDSYHFGSAGYDFERNEINPLDPGSAPIHFYFAIDDGTAPVPEPASLALLGMGGLPLLGMLRRRK